MGRRRYVPLRRLRDVPLKRPWVFHLRLGDVCGDVIRRGDVLMGRRFYVLLRRRHEVPITS